jgi:hypothetical protein
VRRCVLSDAWLFLSNGFSKTLRASARGFGM